MGSKCISSADVNRKHVFVKIGIYLSLNIFC